MYVKDVEEEEKERRFKKKKTILKNLTKKRGKCTTHSPGEKGRNAIAAPRVEGKKNQANWKLVFGVFHSTDPRFLHHVFHCCSISAYTGTRDSCDGPVDRSVRNARRPPTRRVFFVFFPGALRFHSSDFETSSPFRFTNAHLNYRNLYEIISCTVYTS